MKLVWTVSLPLSELCAYKVKQQILHFAHAHAYANQWGTQEISGMGKVCVSLYELSKYKGSFLGNCRFSFSE